MNLEEALVFLEELNEYEERDSDPDLQADPLLGTDIVCLPPFD